MDTEELQHKYHKKASQTPLQKGKKIKYFLIFGVIVLGVFLWQRGCHHVQPKEVIVAHEKNDTVETINAIQQNIGDDIETCTITEGDIPADIFKEYGKYDANDTAAIIDGSKEVFDLTHLKIGQNVRFYFEDGDERAHRMEYDCNTEKKIVVERNGDDFNVHEEDIDYDVTETISRGTIDDFFYVDAMDAGMSEATVVEVADLFAFDIDFMTDIQKGDDFVIVYEKRTRDGNDAPDGKILAGKFVNNGKAHYAYYYEDNGKEGYYDGDGHILEKQFLKAPLSYRRITSTFTGARLHPITKKISTHYQVDYAAPIGTPVVASARGTVTQASWAGGWGRIVRMQHDNGFTTHYGHLSGFAKGITPGTHVDQGQVIGYVGSTGWSTGPHLDYGMKQNGIPINPLTFTQPKGEPLPEEKIEDFEKTKERYANILQ